MEKEREKEFGWWGGRERENDDEFLRFWGDIYRKVRVTHHTRCVAHVAQCISAVWPTLGHIY